MNVPEIDSEELICALKCLGMSLGGPFQMMSHMKTPVVATLVARCGHASVSSKLVKTHFRLISLSVCMCVAEFGYTVRLGGFHFQPNCKRVNNNHVKAER